MIATTSFQPRNMPFGSARKCWGAFETSFESGSNFGGPRAGRPRAFEAQTLAARHGEAEVHITVSAPIFPNSLPRTNVSRERSTHWSCSAKHRKGANSTSSRPWRRWAVHPRSECHRLYESLVTIHWKYRYRNGSLLAAFPESGTKLIQAVSYAHSIGSTIAKLEVQLPNRATAYYFLKVPSRQHGC